MVLLYIFLFGVVSLLQVNECCFSKRAFLYVASCLHNLFSSIRCTVRQVNKVRVQGLGLNSSYLAWFFLFSSWFYDKVQSDGSKKQKKKKKKLKIFSLAEVQSGFRRGRGCTDQIFIVGQICERYLGMGKDVYFAFLDLEKAYSRVDRGAMWNVLRLNGIGGRLLRGVKSLYVGSKACVRVGNEVSEWFQ